MSRRTGFERKLRDELHAARPPRAEEAERRAWHVVRAAHASRSPVRSRRLGRRLAMAAAAAAAVAALALTPAGAEVGDWIGDVVDPSPEPARSTLDSLPTEGRLLVVAESGPFVVRDDGAKDHMPGFRDATWSPGGLHLAAARGDELVALEPDGDERWSRPTPGRVSLPRWSPDGFRIAYLSGRDLYVSIGDNSDRWLIARTVARTPVAWKPEQPVNAQVLAYARGRRVYLAQVDERSPTRRILARTPVGPAPRELWWSADGRFLVAVSERAVRVHDQRGRLVATRRLPRRTRAEGSAMAPDGRRLAVASERRSGRWSEVLVYGVRSSGRLTEPRERFASPAAIEGMTWSIDGKILVVGLPQADRWLFLRPRDPATFDALKRVRALFRGGREPRTGAFPRPAGWCYAEPRSPDEPRVPCSSGAAR
jgi:dipeptidyl aminopeptidase/acylaminoacyl peptidase